MGGPRIVSLSGLKGELGLPKEHKEDRAFGWPAGTVRAILAIGLVVGLVAGVFVGLYLDGGTGATQAGAALGGPAGSGTAYYFANRSKT